MNAATGVTASFAQMPVTLTVSKAGVGTGTVTSAPTGITCGGDCSETVAPGTQFTLTATPAAGSTFTGWGGACSGTGGCTVTVNAATTVTATFSAGPVALTVSKLGTGVGTVTSSPPGIACGTDCSETVNAGTTLTLLPTPAVGSTFVGWGGACAGTGGCTVTVNAATAVTATFSPTPGTLTLARSGAGIGTVTSTPAGITCGTDCSAAAAPGTTFTLTATPALGSVFAGWSGACSGTAPCAVSIGGATTVTATFTQTPVLLSVGKTGSGTGTVMSAPAGIACGNDCSEPIAPGTTVTLTAIPGAGSLFAGWTGACGGTGACTLTVSAATTVSATFSVPQPPVTVSVAMGGTGMGTVAGTTAGIVCGTDCSGSVMPGTPVTLTATPAAGSVFVGWGGACTGSAASCAWMASSAATVTATFDTTRVDRPLEPAPAPIAGSLVPATVPAGGTGFMLTVNGTGFTPRSVVRWNGASRPTTFVSSTQLRVTVSAPDIISPRSLPVAVFTPGPGGGTSAPLGLVVAMPVARPVAPGRPTTIPVPSLPPAQSFIPLPFAPTPQQAPGWITVDNAGPGVQDSVGGRTFTGSWCSARAAHRFGSASLYACGRGVDTYRWTPSVPTTGVYDVYVWVTASAYLSSSVPFAIVHGEGTTKRTVDQRTGTGRWVRLGRYSFDAGTTGYVEASFDHTTGATGTAAADAIRLVPVR